MFDSSNNFQLSTLDKAKTCTVRFPSDQEWCSRARAERTIRKDLGRGKSRFEESGSSRQIDAQLFEKIRVDKDGPELDEYETEFIVSRLERTQVLDTGRSGVEYSVRMKVLGGALVTHLLGVPSQRQISQYTAASIPPPTHSNNTTEFRVILEPAGALYDAIAAGTEGYAGPVPIIHKAVAIQAVIRHMNEQFEEDDPED